MAPYIKSHGKKTPQTGNQLHRAPRIIQQSAHATRHRFLQKAIPKALILLRPSLRSRSSYRRCLICCTDYFCAPAYTYPLYMLDRCTRFLYQYHKETCLSLIGQNLPKQLLVPCLILTQFPPLPSPQANQQYNPSVLWKSLFQPYLLTLHKSQAVKCCFRFKAILVF